MHSLGKSKKNRRTCLRMLLQVFKAMVGSGAVLTDYLSCQMLRKFLLLLGIFNDLCSITCHIFDCHDDPSLEPEEGSLSELQFNWLGALQYIHVKEGTPHYFRVPRVTLITKQFVISTARDAAQIPEGYALGNVVFGEYERDEGECKVSIEDIAKGMQCDPAVLLMPIADVLLHPEYKHFGIKSSIALLKLLTPLKSRYMLPACLPFKNFLFEKENQIIWRLSYVDFTSEVPRDFADEEKELTYLVTLDQDVCLLHENPLNATYVPGNRYICTTGCDLQSGAPSVIKEHTGHWNIVSLSEGGPACPDPLRGRGAPRPARHVALHPYVPWITTAISGKPVGAMAKDDPFGYIMPRTMAFERQARAWLGRWWLAGIRCYDRGEAANDMYRFYHEMFQIYPNPKKLVYITYYLEIHAAYAFKVACVKVGMPYQLDNPMVWGLHSDSVKLRIPVLTLAKFYEIVVEAWYSTNEEISEDDEESDGEETEDESSSSSSSSSEDEDDYEDTTEYEEGPPRKKKKQKGKDKGKDTGKDTDKDKDKGKDKGKKKGKGKKKNKSDETDEESLKPPDAGVEPED